MLVYSVCYIAVSVMLSCGETKLVSFLNLLLHRHGSTHLVNHFLPKARRHHGQSDLLGLMYSLMFNCQSNMHLPQVFHIDRKGKA